MRATGGADGGVPGEPTRLLADPRTGASDTGAFAVALLRSVRPHQSSPARQQRLRLSLGRSTPARAKWFLRPTVMSTILLGAAAAAAGSAALGYWPPWQGRVDEGPIAHVTTAPDGRKVSVHQPPEIAPEAPPRTSSAVRSPIGPAPRPEIRGGGPAEAATRRLRESTPHPSRTSGGISGEDTSAVLEAVRALRRQHDPARARMLLATYLDQHPNGTLAEEALAMSIEAALAQRDREATVLAGRYLSRYPAGPFRALARDALAQDASPEAGSTQTRPR